MGRDGDSSADQWHECPCDALCSGTTALPFACRTDAINDSVSPRTERERYTDCVNREVFTCSETFAGCCPGTDLGNGRCGDCCIQTGIAVGIVLLLTFCAGVVVSFFVYCC